MKVHHYSKALSWITRPRVTETATAETYTPELDRMKFSPGGSVDLSKEYYGPQKSDWLKNFPDLSWEEYLRYQSSGSFDKGGRVEMKPGGLVEPGVTHYGKTATSRKYIEKGIYRSTDLILNGIKNLIYMKFNLVDRDKITIFIKLLVKMSLRRQKLLEINQLKYSKIREPRNFV